MSEGPRSIDGLIQQSAGANDLRFSVWRFKHSNHSLLAGISTFNKSSTESIKRPGAKEPEEYCTGHPHIASNHGIARHAVENGDGLAPEDTSTREVEIISETGVYLKYDPYSGDIDYC